MINSGYQKGLLIQLLFIPLLGLAILFFKGGTINDPTTVGYSFYGNFISELGAVTAHNGEFNSPSIFFFIGAMLSVAVGCALFFIEEKELLDSTKNTFVFAKIGTFFGILAAICFGLVAIPFDAFEGSKMVHTYAAQYAFRCILLALIFNGIAIVFDPKFPTIFGALNLLASFAVAKHSVDMYLNDFYSGYIPLSDVILSQKIAVISLIVCFIARIVGTKFILKKLGKA